MTDKPQLTEEDIEIFSKDKFIGADGLFIKCFAKHNPILLRCKIIQALQEYPKLKTKFENQEKNIEDARYYLTNHLQYMGSVNHRLVKRNEKLEGENQKLKAEIEELKKDIKYKHMIIVDYERDFLKLEQEIQQLKQRELSVKEWLGYQVMTWNNILAHHDSNSGIREHQEIKSNYFREINNEIQNILNPEEEKK